MNKTSKWEFKYAIPLGTKALVLLQFSLVITRLCLLKSTHVRIIIELRKPIGGVCIVRIKLYPFYISLLSYWRVYRTRLVIYI